MSIKAWLILMLLCLPFPLSAIMTRKWVALLPANKIWRKLVVNTFWLSLALSLLMVLMLHSESGEAGMLLGYWLIFSPFYMILCVLVSLYIGPVLVFLMQKKHETAKKRIKETEV